MNQRTNKLQSTRLLVGLLALMCLPCLLIPLLVIVVASSIPVFGYLGVALLIATLMTAYAIRQRHKASCNDCITTSRRKW